MTMEHISDIVRRVIASLEKDAVIQTTGEPDGRPYLTGGGMIMSGEETAQAMYWLDRIELNECAKPDLWQWDWDEPEEEEES